MYKDVVTLFNRKKTRDGDIWYATVLTGVNLNCDRGAIVKAYGEASQDNAVLNIALGSGRTIQGRPYMQPKEWARLGDPQEAITVKSGSDADFFWAGEWTGSTVISNDSYGIVGFRDYMEKNFDGVYEVTGVSEFSVIPHLEVVGK